MRIVGAALLTLVLLPAPSTAADWVRVQSESFSVFSDADPELANQIDRQLEQLVAVLEQLFPQRELRPPVPVFTFLFATPESFEPFRLRVGGRTVDVPGYLVPAEYAVFAALLGADPEGATRTVYKQYVQYLLHAHLPTLPDWLHTGVAELYSTFAVRGDEALIGLPAEQHLTWLRPAADDLIPAARLLTIGSLSELDGKELALAPAQSWALVHSLFIGSDEDRARARDLVRALADGDDPETALRATVGLDFAALDERLAAYVRQEELEFLRVPIDSIPVIDAETRSLPSAEVEFRLGTLLLQLGPDRLGEAEQHMRRATEIDPGLGPGWAGLAYATEQGGDAAGALPLYEKAAVLAPDHALVQLLYGESLLGALGRKRPSNDAEQATLDRAIGALRRSTDLDPQSSQAWARLGYAGNLQPKGSEETVAALERAAALMPSRTDVAYNQVLAYGRGGDRVSADEAYQRMRRLSADGDSLARAREVLLQLDYADAVKLAYANELEDAVGLLVMIAAETTSPTVRERAEEQMARLTLAERHNEFARLYGGAVTALRAGDRATAASTIEALRALARPGRQVDVVDALSEQVGAD